jgi:beta-catenin-like protein 1
MPDKFMDSELELHTAVEELYPVAASPELFHVLITSGGFGALLGLVIHENTDISLAVITLFQEICDAEMIQEADQSSEDEDASIGAMLVKAFVDSQGLEIIVQNLTRLDEKNQEDATGVYNTLSIIDNLVELDASTASRICEKTHLLKFLLKRLAVKEYDANKLYSSELLSILLQTDPAVSRSPTSNFRLKFVKCILSLGGFADCTIRMG